MYELETLIVAILAACFSIVGTLYFLVKATFHWYNKAKFKACFPDSSSRLDCRIGEERTICIDVGNSGRRGVKVEEIFLYLPEDFEVKTVALQDTKAQELKTLPKGAGIYEGYSYIPVVSAMGHEQGGYFAPKQNLKCYFDIKLPEKGKSCSLFVAIYPVHMEPVVLNLQLVLT